MEAVTRNYVSGKLKSRQGIHDVGNPAEIAISHRERGNSRGPRWMLPQLQFLEVIKEKRFVFLNRPTDVAAKLIPFERGLLHGKEISRVHGIVAQELKKSAVVLIGSAFGGYSDLSAFATTGFSIVGVRLDLELLYLVDRRLVDVREHVVR